MKARHSTAPSPYTTTAASDWLKARTSTSFNAGEPDERAATSLPSAGLSSKVTGLLVSRSARLRVASASAMRTPAMTFPLEECCTTTVCSLPTVAPGVRAAAVVWVALPVRVAVFAPSAVGRVRAWYVVQAAALAAFRSASRTIADLMTDVAEAWRLLGSCDVVASCACAGCAARGPKLPTLVVCDLAGGEAEDVFAWLASFRADGAGVVVRGGGEGAAVGRLEKPLAIERDWEEELGLVSFEPAMADVVIAKRTAETTVQRERVDRRDMAGGLSLVREEPVSGPHRIHQPEMPTAIAPLLTRKQPPK